MEREHDETAGVIAPPPLIFAGGLLLGWGLDLLLALPELSTGTGARWGGGIAVLLLAAALIGWSLRALARAGTAVEPWEPTTAIVTTGPFALSRNPIYLAMGIAFVAVAWIGGSRGMFLMLVPTILVVRFGVIRREERYLARRFGEPYERYRTRVRRWL